MYASTHLRGDVNVHNEDWLVFSNKNTAEGTECQNFALVHDLTHIVFFPTRIPDIEDYYESLLDLFLLISTPDLCQASSGPPL